MRRTHRSWVLALLAVLALVATACGRGGGQTKAGTSDPGITATTIKLGGSYPFSGPASAYGTIGVSAKAYFDWLNAKGGVNGRKIEFTTLDDGYEPARALQNAKRLVEQDKVFALFNTLGTANNLTTWDYLNQQKVPQVYVATGASEFGADPAKHPFTIGWQPDYVAEARVYASYLAREKPNAKVAVLYQNDAFGKDLLDGFKSAVQAIHGLTQIDWKPLHILNNVSASKTLVLQPAGLAASKGIVSVSYFKDPEDPRWAS